MFVGIHLWCHLFLTFVLGGFLITDSISLLVISLFMFSISSWFSHGKYTFLRICPFIHISFVIVPCGPLYICGVSYNFSFFISYFINFVYVFKELCFSSIDLSTFFFLFFFFFTISFMPAPIFMISCLLLTLGFVYFLFSSSIQCKIRLFISDFPCFIAMLFK